MPEAERRSIQFDLVWTGDFTGTNSGSFGPLTFRAINAFKSKSGAVTDGMLSAADRKALAIAAKGARDAVAFQVVPDARTGARIGIPQQLLPKKDVTPSGGSRWQSADGRITLDTRTGQKGDTLQALFEKATTSTTPGRRITYKLLRPDFYVVSGETASGKFYSRLASGPEGLRGFSVGYDKALAEKVDLLVIAMANSFEPFPGAIPPIAIPSIAIAAAVPAAIAAKPMAEGLRPSAAAGLVPPRPNERHGVGLIVGQGLVLTARAAVAECRAVKVGARAARVKHVDEASGLALLEVEGLGMVSLPRLSAAEPAADDAVTLAAFAGAAGQALMMMPGHITAATSLSVNAPLQPGGAGAVVHDRFGAVLGLVTANPSERFEVAGIVPPRSYPMAGRVAIAGMLQKAGVSLGASVADKPVSTGMVAQAALSQVIALTCAP